MSTHASHNQSTLAENPRASFDYEILDTLEAGIELLGFEVKSARAGRMSIRGSFVTIHGNEALLTGATIAPYQPANTPVGYDPARSRRLLLKHEEASSLIGKIRVQGLTVVPLKAYDKKGRIKVLIGVARGKKKRDKREQIKKRDIEREIRRAEKK